MFSFNNIINLRGNNKEFLNIYNNSLKGNYSAVVDALMNDGVKYINYYNGQGNGWTALHAAASNGHVKTMQLLISNGIKLDAQDDSGNTALHIAAHNGHKGAVDLLLKSGASATITNGRNDTAYECIEDEEIKDMMSNLFKCTSDHKISTLKY
jgi:ankyrin repeat protein